MSAMTSKMSLRGSLATRKISITDKAPMEWQLAQLIRKDRINGLLGKWAGDVVSNAFGIVTIGGQLKAVKIDGLTGRRTDFGIVSRRVITTAFVNFMVDQLQAETSVWGDFKWHDSGVGTTAAVIGDTDIETTDAEARVAGTQVEGATAEIYKSVGTITYTTTLAITEHGLFSIVTGGTLMDRHVFTAINVVNTDQIEFTYELTVNDGG